MTAVLPETVFYRVGSTHYAFGLDWLTAATGGAARQQTRRAAVNAKATHLAWRPRYMQAGMARVTGHPPASPFNPWRSAGAAFADLSHASLLAAFPLNDGNTWVLAAANGHIFPDGDRIFADEEQARLHFKQFHDKQRWHTIFAPAAWGIYRAGQTDPLAVLKAHASPLPNIPMISRSIAGLGLQRKPGCPLRKFNVGASGAPNVTRTAAAVAAIVVAGLCGYNYWRTHHHVRPAAQAPLRPYYPRIVSADRILKECIAVLPDILSGYVTPGWDITDAVCSADSVTVTQTAKAYTPLSTMAVYHPEAVVAGDKRTATIELPSAPAPDPLPLSLPLLSSSQYLSTFGIIDEHAAASNSLNAAVPSADAAPVENGMRQPRPYRVQDWTFTTRAPPPMWAEDLARLPNMTVGVVSLKLTETGLTWTVKGTAYVGE